MSTFRVVLRKGEAGFWITSCPALPGCHSQGRTKKEALANIREAIEGCLEVLNERARRASFKNSQILKVAI